MTTDSDGVSAAGRSHLVLIADSDAGLVALPTGVAGTGVDADQANALLRAANATVQPLFGSTEADVRDQRNKVEAELGTSLPDLSIYYAVDAAQDELGELAARLRLIDGIAGAYVDPPASLPVDLEVIRTLGANNELAPAVTPDFTARQIYLNRAPAGIDARYAWTLPGGRGTGVRIIDVEGAWCFEHEDLVANQHGIVGTPTTDRGWRNHGTAVASTFGGDVGSFGVTGICPDAQTQGYSVFDNASPAHPARAIRAAADNLRAGDIMLIELHKPGPGANGDGQDGYIAMEWWPAEFDAIKFATACGIIVVEAAGNGYRNLDDPRYDTPEAGFPKSWRNAFKRGFRDSGAIVVGAGAPPPGTHGSDHGPDRSRLDFSNWGAVVDAQGWGREVTAAGYSDLQNGIETRGYTDKFSGTSSASPIVVGACACVQGVARARGVRPLTPAQMRMRLRTTGSSQQDAPGRPASQRIGNRPDLRQLITG